MRRIAQTLLVAAFLAIGIAGGAYACAGSAKGTSASTATSAVQAGGSEFRINLSRSRVAPSKLRLEFVNYGEDDHDLALRRVGGTRTYRIGVVHPGKTGELETRLRAGRFVLWCTLANHRSLGMRATLGVSP